MKYFVAILIFCIFSLKINAQSVRLLNTNPTSNDTLEFELFTTLSNCGSVINFNNNLSSDTLYLNNYYNVFPFF